MRRKLLYRFFEGTCDISDIKKIKEWVEASPENKEKLLEESAWFDAMRISSQREEASFYAHKGKIVFLREFLRIAAVVLFVLGGIAGWRYWKTSDEVAMNVIEVPAGKSANLTLSDGSKVWLNACSSLRYPSMFNETDRDVFLEGEAYFEVSADKKHPFIVHTKEHDVQVFGTSFHVQSLSERFSVALMTGALRVSSPELGQEEALTPGYMIYMENGRLREKKITDYDPYRWREGLICFDDIHFSELMNLFEKYYAVKIEIDNEKVKNYVCTGKFRQSDGIDYALNILKKDVSFTYMREEETNTIHIK